MSCPLTRTQAVREVNMVSEVEIDNMVIQENIKSISKQLEAILDRISALEMSVAEDAALQIEEEK